MFMPRFVRGALILSCALSACGGGHSTVVDGGARGGASATEDDRGDASTVSEDGGASATDGSGYSYTDGAVPFVMNEAGQVLCGSIPCACSNGLDEDGDGLIDLADPECVAPWDDDEASFATGISGDNRDDACQDCFFDGNSGAGDDGCRLPSSCLSDGTAASGRGSCSSCEQSDQCVSFCKAYTPNGCDCFGCCGVLVAGEVHDVLIGGNCQIDGDTLSGCTACVQNPSCANPCGECELCPGKTVADLPPSCGGAPDGGVDAGSPQVSCDDGESPCGAGLPACAAGSACTYGCCVQVPAIL